MVHVMSEVKNQLAFEIGQTAENGDGYLFTQEQFDDFCKASTTELLPILKDVLGQQKYELEHRGARYRARWQDLTSRLEGLVQRLGDNSDE